MRLMIMTILTTMVVPMLVLAGMTERKFSEVAGVQSALPLKFAAHLEP